LLLVAVAVELVFLEFLMEAVVALEVIKPALHLCLYLLLTQ